MWEQEKSRQMKFLLVVVVAVVVPSPGVEARPDALDSTTYIPSCYVIGRLKKEINTVYEDDNLHTAGLRVGET